MKNYQKIIALLLALCMIFALSACGGEDQEENSGSNAGNNGGSNSAGKIKADEDDFEWDDDYIIGLSSKGAKKKSVVIPARCVGFLATVFADTENSVEEVSFETDDITSLDGVFSFAPALKKVHLPANLSEINNIEFWLCESLESIAIPASVTRIGDCAFQDCIALESVTFEGNGVETIEYMTFGGCTALSSIEIPESVTKIGESAFQDCTALTEVTLPAGLKELGAFAFMNSGLTDVYVPEELELTFVDTTAFAQAESMVTIHVVEGSWADVNFDEAFGDHCAKVYQ